MRKFVTLFVVLLLMVPAMAFADDMADLEKKVERLEKRLKNGKSTVEFSGDYQFRFDSLSGTVPDYITFEDMMTWYMGGMVGFPTVTPGYDVENSDLMTNRFGLNIKAKATEDVTVKARLLMYKAWGHQDSQLYGYFADRMMVFDGNTSHVPQDSILRVDQAYASWTGIADQPIWFSVGRRPSTGGVPTNLRHNQEKNGAGGTPGILVDYAFDGLVLGYAPEINVMPGAYFKFCYGKGFDAGIQDTTSTLEDVKMVGLDMAFYDTESLHIEAQYNKAMDIFAVPEDTFSTLYNAPNVNLGDIEQMGIVVSGKNMNINWFASYGYSKASPNDQHFMDLAGLLHNNMGAHTEEDQTGNAIYVGARYDIDSAKTKIGVEYNQGSEYWLTFTPAADDMWTSKLATRGNVVEVYVIKELDQKAASRHGNAYWRLGYQKYTFDYTGSGNWLGAPADMDDLSTDPMSAQMMIPIEEAEDLYLTFNVEF